MTIVEALKKLIVSKGGNALGVKTVSDAAKVLTDMENAANPLSVLSIDVDVAADTDLLGKVIGDLQSNVAVGPRYVTGTLKYVTGYTGFSGLEAEQSGHYLVLHADLGEVTGATVTIKGSHKAGEKELDMTDGILIQRVPSKDITLTFTAKKSGYPDYAVTLDLSKLELKPAS